VTGATAPQPDGPFIGAPPPSDWTEQVSLLQPRQLAFWLFSALFLLGGIAFVQEQNLYVHVSTSAWLIGLVLLALYAVPVYLLVNSIDLFEREPGSLLLGAFLWGAVVATFLAGNVNSEWSSILQKLFGAAFTREWGAALIAPAVEELVKFLGVVVVYLIARHEFDDALDGFVYGAMVGLGFTVAEDMYYFFTQFVGSTGEGGLGALFEGFFIRVIVGGPYSHVLMTGLTGLGLAYYVTRPDVARGRRLLVAVALYAAGVVTHFVWNSPLLDELLGRDPGPTDWLVYAAVKGLPFLLLLVVLVRLAMRREHAWVRESLADDVAAALVTNQEVEALGDRGARRRARQAAAAIGGPAAGRLVARLQHAQVALAVAATGRSADRDARIARERTTIQRLRGELARLRVGGAQPGTMPGQAPPAPIAFQPTHLVPAGGMPAWAVPDGTTQATPLAAGLPLAVVQQIGDWAQVRAVNGWTGWVDARRLIVPPAPAPEPAPAPDLPVS
jgi:RsiW-degrading membrane proteinase PrsW (M82 family)